ncbi:MAG: FMN-binding glutamate synthase family protein [Candidatus Aminicenantes bacterium]|nr:FMN-binding glutamate synthase family protein [Candidatus Aminicenantes bacterium]MDH5465831.1 FMN-binding glutamate synthase family protein [Candidatus Aminicenantes bacterium]MDH5704592.1 FMN-binding glutamate synthase family protein [Candidatus Aminicenantes bacterium]
MAYTKLNRSAATLTKNRTEGSISPFSGMCVTCVDGCIGMCEIGKSAYRGHEVLYPQPFGIITAASEKEYPVDLSDFTIMGTAVGAHGVEADSDKATFPKVTIETAIGHDKGIKLKVPFIISGMGSTNVAKQNWEGLAKGAALSGSILTVGENVCGMDDESEIKNGKVVRSPDMERRVNFFKEFQEDGYGTVVVQANVEDTRLGVHEYVIEKLGVEVVELKWGQGAKDIGGEVKIKSLEKAQALKKKGYIVLPDPDDPDVIKAFEKGSFKEFERHSRLGMVEEESFMKRVEELRKAGAKYVFLKTGAYRPADLARAVKYASKARLDLLTVDGAGGGTGMSPWRMMNEWGIPSVEIWSLLYQYLKKLDEKGEHIPDVAAAGGITFEDQIYKALALGAPYFKVVGMARGPMAATMVGKTIGKRIDEGQIPVYVERFGNTAEEIFVTAPELKKKYKERFNNIPTGAMGLYTYFHRLSQGLRQLMAGNRKFSLKYITRDDIASLTQDAANISGISFITEVDKEEVEKILKS